MLRLAVTALLCAVFSLSLPAFAAAPTPEPGGADAIAAVSGGFNTFVFNGLLRIKATELVAPAAGSLAVPAGQHYLVLHAIVKNGSTKSYTNYPPLDATIVDADGVTIQTSKSFGIRDDIDFMPRVTSVETYLPGAAWRTQIPFLVPNDFVPVKIVLSVPGDKHKAFRITVKPTDIKT